MRSNINNIIVNNPDAADQVPLLLAAIQTMMAGVLRVRNALATSEEKLDSIMNANGDNSNEHYAKTMMFYGRKFCGSDVMRGCNPIDASSPSGYKDIYSYNLTDCTPYISQFDGLDKILPTMDAGTYEITWDCMDGVDGTSGSTKIYKDGYEPATTSLVQKHVIGSNVIMPTIKNMDSADPGFGAGTNTYRLKNGYSIVGWKLKTTCYMLNPTGNSYRLQTTYTVNPSGGAPVPHTNKIVDSRVFSFDDDLYPLADNIASARGSSYDFKLPFNTALSPVFPTHITFVLELTTKWFDLVFVVPHDAGSPDTAPWKKTIKTRLGNTVTMPQPTQINFESGWVMDKSRSPYGTWTTVNPVTGAPDVDPDGDAIPELYCTPGESYVIGQDLDAGVKQTSTTPPENKKYLYLMVVMG